MGKSGAHLVRTDSMYMQLLPHAHLGHCYLMQDDLQKAYSAYQHALYSLPNPKVSALTMPVNESFFLQSNRKIRNYGMGLESFMTGTGPWIMQRRLSRQC